MDVVKGKSLMDVVKLKSPMDVMHSLQVVMAKQTGEKGALLQSGMHNSGL